MRIDLLKPRREEVLSLALQETDPSRCDDFSPIVRGPLFAAAALAALAAVSPLLMLGQGVRRLLRSR